MLWGGGWGGDGAEGGGVEDGAKGRQIMSKLAAVLHSTICHEAAMLKKKGCAVTSCSDWKQTHGYTFINATKSIVITGVVIT